MPNGERTTADILRATKPWVRFMSILGFILVGFIVIAGFALIAIGMMTSDDGALVSGAVYPLLGLLYAFPSLYLFRYASRIGDFLRDGHVEQLNAALTAQKSFWKFVGILTIVMLVIYALLLVGLILIALMAAAA
jgi:hypothetical protein